MKQISKILSIAALFAMGALTVGCNSLKEEMEVPTTEPVVEKTVTLTSTVGFEATTKALTALGKKTFAEGEQIAVIYKQEGGTTAKAVSEALTDADIREGGRKADFTVTMTNPAAGGAVRYIYPAAMALDPTSVDPANDKYTIATSNLTNSQDGSLPTLAANFDLAVYDGTLTDGATLPASVTLQNRLAILELMVKNASGSSVNGSVTKLSVYDGANYYLISRTPADESIYVALWPVSSEQTIAFCATDGTKNYRKSVTGKTLDRNNIYPVRLTTTESTGTALELVTGKYTVQDGETLSGTLFGTTKIVTAETKKDGEPITVTLDGVDISCNSSDPGINCQGNTNLVLAAGSVNHVTANNAGYAGIFIKKDMTLTISGSGTLTANGYGNSAEDEGDEGGAGIGGNTHSTCGNIVITGGTITARGGKGSAGIGCGAYDRIIKGYSRCGNITITGGNVTATGGQLGAGIGSAYVYYHKGTTGNSSSTSAYNECGDITITGGTVTAEGGSKASGIGCGYNSGRNDNFKVGCGDITITSGVISVTATKGSDSSPYSIGKGVTNNGGKQYCGTITIGCTLDDEGDPVGGIEYYDSGISDSPFTYQP